MKLHESEQIRNILRRQFRADRRKQIWVSDVARFKAGGTLSLYLRDFRSVFGHGRKFSVSEIRQTQEYRIYNVHDRAYFPSSLVSLGGGTVCAPLAA